MNRIYRNRASRNCIDICFGELFSEKFRLEIPRRASRGAQVPESRAKLIFSSESTFFSRCRNIVRDSPDTHSRQHLILLNMATASQQPPLKADDPMAGMAHSEVKSNIAQYHKTRTDGCLQAHYFNSYNHHGERSTVSLVCIMRLTIFQVSTRKCLLVEPEPITIVH